MWWYNLFSLRVWYNGYYSSFPNWRREFDSLHPHQDLYEEKEFNYFANSTRYFISFSRNRRYLFAQSASAAKLHIVFK